MTFRFSSAPAPIAIRPVSDVSHTPGSNTRVRRRPSSRPSRSICSALPCTVPRAKACRRASSQMQRGALPRQPRALVVAPLLQPQHRVVPVSTGEALAHRLTGMTMPPAGPPPGYQGPQGPQQNPSRPAAQSAAATAIRPWPCRAPGQPAEPTSRPVPSSRPAARRGPRARRDPRPRPGLGDRRDPRAVDLRERPQRVGLGQRLGRAGHRRGDRGARHPRSDARRAVGAAGLAGRGLRRRRTGPVLGAVRAAQRRLEHVPADHDRRRGRRDRRLGRAGTGVGRDAVQPSW